MKQKARIILILIAVLTISIVTHAQKWRTPFTKLKLEDGKHIEDFNPHLGKSGISIGYGYMPLCATSWWPNKHMHSMISTWVPLTSTTTNNIGTISFAYTILPKPWLEITIPITYSHSSGNLYRSNPDQYYSNYDEDYFFLTPTVKISWLYNKFFHLYTRVGAGIGLCNRHELSDQNSVAINSKLAFIWQVSPIGIELGKKVKFFVEGGFGHFGLVNGGIKIRFGTNNSEQFNWYERYLQ